MFDDLARWFQRDWLMAELDVCAPEEPGEGKTTKLSRKAKKIEPGYGVIAEADAEWLRDVREPRGEANRVDEYIRGDQGLGWGTADAVDWTPDAPYTRNGMFQWCGAFAAFCWGAAGLNAALRSKRWASTVRLYNWAQGTDRVINFPEGLQPGDVVVVSRGKKKQGEHICLVDHVDLDAQLVHTIEGNAKGRGPGGDVFEGVIKRTRPWPRALGGLGRRDKMRCPVSGLSQSMEIVHAYRPLPEDLK